MHNERREEGMQNATSCVFEAIPSELSVQMLQGFALHPLQTLEFGLQMLGHAASEIIAARQV